ncbi:MAG: hypothetical protein EKK54_01270 [Neisseriaceae bacterium]|nr:MAG: hypothetical protein EKK54_01270 [Neisseriaceae bacterium]
MKVINVISRDVDMYIARIETKIGICNVNFRVLGSSSLLNVILIHQTISNDMYTLSDSNGWWEGVVGYNQVLDLEKYTVFMISKLDVIRIGITNFFEIAEIEDKILSSFGVEKIFLNIGGSFGGAGALSFSTISDKDIVHNIIISFTHQQYNHQVLYRRIILKIFNNAIDSNYAAKLIQQLNVLFYRSPIAWEELDLSVEIYLDKLNCKIPSVKSNDYISMINMLLEFEFSKTNIEGLKGKIHLVFSKNDNMYLKDHIEEFFHILTNMGKLSYLHELVSIKGHDAFLIEQNKLSKILSNIIMEE